MNVDFNLYLDEGEANAVHMMDLANRIGVHDRTLRQLIYNARAAGVQILASDNGYFFPSTQGEIIAFETRQRKRAIASLKVSKMRKSVKNQQIEGQMSLADYFTDFE